MHDCTAGVNISLSRPIRIHNNGGESHSMHLKSEFLNLGTSLVHWTVFTVHMPTFHPLACFNYQIVHHDRGERRGSSNSSILNLFRYHHSDELIRYTCGHCQCTESSSQSAISSRVHDITYTDSLSHFSCQHHPLIVFRGTNNYVTCSKTFHYCRGVISIWKLGGGGGQKQCDTSLLASR